VMYFNERSDLNQAKYKQSNSDSQNPQEPLTYQFRGSNLQHARERRGGLAIRAAGDLAAGEVLNTANNRLQELMQLLYLLSRDPAVPKDARYHVTVAQSEIALLVRIMRNAEEAAPRSAVDRPDGAAASPSTY